MASISAFDPRGPCDLSGCQSSGTPTPSPRAILYGDFFTWTTAPDWNRAGIVGGTVDGGTVHTIEMYGQYHAWGTNNLPVPKGIMKITTMVQVATASGKTANPNVGRWRILPVDSNLIGLPIQYNGAPFRLQYYSDQGNTGEFFKIPPYQAWPSIDYNIGGKYAVVEAQFVFTNPNPSNPFNTGTLLPQKRLENGNHVYYGDAFGMAIANDMSWWKGSIKNTPLYIWRANNETDGTAQEGWGYHAPFAWPTCKSNSRPPCMGPFYAVWPFLAERFRPDVTKKGEYVTEAWHAENYSYHFMAWPDGQPIGYQHVMAQDSCKCNCEVSKSGGNQWRFCPQSSTFPTCNKTTDSKGVARYEWSSCKPVLLCNTGREGKNACGDLSALNAGSAPPDTVFCCDPVARQWKVRSRSVPAGVAFACPAQTTAQEQAYDRATAGVLSKCPAKNRWQCAPAPAKKALTAPMVDTARRKAFRDAAAAAAASTPETPPSDAGMESNYSCLSEETPIFLCDLPPSSSE